jgi:uncharacterized protein YhaN
MAKQKSRTTRWMEAVAACRQQMDTIQGAADDLVQALNDLHEVQAEYEDWQGNLPENLAQSALGEKLDAVMDIDIESVMNEPLENWGDLERAVDEAEGADLPIGFGRD